MRCQLIMMKLMMKMIKTKTIGVFLTAGVGIVASLMNTIRLLQGQDTDFYLILIAFGMLGALFIASDD